MNKPKDAELLPVAQDPTKYEPPAIIDDSPVAMMRSMIKSGISAENVAAFTELVKLSEHMEDRKAAKDFAVAFNDLQAEMPKVQAVSAVPNNDGTVRYMFCPYEELMRQVAPFLHKHGFSITFSNRFDEGRLVSICTLTHVSGHSKTNEFTVRIGKGPPGSSESQADGAAGTYAKRFALISALNIVVEKDSDARIVGGKISKGQADSLRQRVASTGSDQALFLKFAQAATFEDISESMYDVLDASLKKKERTHA